MKVFECFLVAFILAMFPGGSSGMTVLSDEQLSSVAAGESVVESGGEPYARIPFTYATANGTVEGEAIVLPMTMMQQTSLMQISDNAQSNLSSLISINSVNSPIQILLNLNVNVNSTVGNLNQWNRLAGR